MKFGFIAHVRTVRELRRAFLLRHHLSMIPFCSDEVIKKEALERGFVDEIFAYRKIYSPQGVSCSGSVLVVFLTPEQLLEHQEKAVELISRACERAAAQGAEIIGLGAMTAVVGSRGIEVSRRSPVPVTTGNALTVYATLKAFREMIRKLRIDIYRHEIVIVGFPGSIALALTRLLLKEGLTLILVGRSQTRFFSQFLLGLDEKMRKRIEVRGSLKEALKSGRIIFSATSSGNIIDPDTLRPGSIVFDIAQPRDVIKKREKRKDILVVDAGTISLPKTNGIASHSVYLNTFPFFPFPIWLWRYHKMAFYNYSGIGPFYIPSCLAETITLALEERKECFSLGRELDLEKISEIGRLSEKHGFVFDLFLSFEQLIQEEDYEHTRRALMH